jgi:hypothetical protein
MAGAFRLRVHSGRDAGKELLVRDPRAGSVLLGRGVNPARDLLCTDDLVSRRHASIDASADGYVLTDLGSTNRTRLNGRLLDPGVPVVLHDGDEIQLGSGTMVSFTLERPARDGEAGLPPARYEFGRYAVYELLDKSELDRVDVAVDTRTGASVALKRFTARGLPHTVVERLLRDARDARRWQHPNIAAVVDAGLVGDVPYVASVLVDGVSVATIQDRCAPEVDVAFALHLVCEACGAVSAATQQEPGFVHGNLNPRNLLIAYSGEVALVNFGLMPLKALLEDASAAERTDAAYLAPEHRGGRPPTAAADVFALGIILYELLAQIRLDRRLLGTLADLATRSPEVPAAVAALTMRAVAVQPTHRFPRVADMDASLRTALHAAWPGYGRADAARWMTAMQLGVATQRAG